MDHLHVAISGVPRQLVVTELIVDKESDMSKMLLEIRSSCPVVSSNMEALQNFTSFTRKYL